MLLGLFLEFDDQLLDLTLVLLDLPLHLLLLNAALLGVSLVLLAQLTTLFQLRLHRLTVATMLQDKGFFLLL